MKRGLEVERGGVNLIKHDYSVEKAFGAKFFENYNGKEVGVHFGSRIEVQIAKR